MFTGFFRKPQTTAAAHGLYMALVEQARQPVFYTDLAVPDTLDGRFDMVCLHMALVLGRLKQDGRQGAALAQALFDTMFIDIDRSVREQGIGDLSVPRHVKRMMRSLKGRCGAYGVTWHDAAELEGALRRNLFGTTPDAPDHAVKSIANYMIEMRNHLSGQESAKILSGDIDFAGGPHATQKSGSNDQPRMAAAV